MAITAAELTVHVVSDTSEAEGGLKSFSSRMESTAGNLAAVGGIISAKIGAPLIGIGVSAVKTAATFQRSMNVLAYTTGASGDTMKAMSDQALQLGADTVFSANEAADGMVELAKAGMDTQEVMDSIPGVMDLAAAGQIGVADAANLTAAALNTFGLKASDSTHVADVLAAAANASTAEVSDLAFGMQNAGTVFASSGQSVETLATMMALLANNGLNASDAATSLKTMTLRLTAPTTDAAKEMKRLGINVFDASGNMRDYHDIVGDLQGAMAGLSDQQQAAAMTTIFGTDAIRAANIMVKEGTKGYEDMNAKVMQQGASADMAAAQNSGLAGAMEQISGSIDSLMTKLALPFLDTLAGWMGKLTEFINKLGDLPQPAVKAGLAVAGFATALGAALLLAAGAAVTIGALANPIGLAVLALIGLSIAVAAAWLAWETNFDNIQGKTDDVMGAVQSTLDTLSSTLSGIGTAISDASSNLDKTAASLAALLAVNPQFQAFIGNVQTAATALGSFGTNLGTIESNLSNTATSLALLLAVNPQFQGFIANVQAAATALQDLGKAVGTGIDKFKLPDMSVLKTNIEMQLVATVKGLELDWENVKVNIGGLVSKVGDLLTGISWSGLTVDFSNFMTQVSDKLSEAATAAFGPDNLISKEIARVKDTINTISSSMEGVDISQPASVLNAGIKDAIAIVELLHGMKTDVLVSSVVGLETFLTTVLNVAAQLAKGIDVTLLEQAATDVVKGFSDAIVKVTQPQKLNDLAKSAAEFTSTLGQKLKEAFADPKFGTDIGTAIGNATGALLAGATALVAGIVGKLGTVNIGEFQASMDTFVFALIQGIITGIGNQDWGKVGGMITDQLWLGLQKELSQQMPASFIPGPLGWIGKMLPSIFQGIDKIFGTDIAKFAPGDIGTQIQKMADAMSILSNFFGQIMASLPGGMKVTPDFQGMFNNITTFFGQVQSVWNQLMGIQASMPTVGLGAGMGFQTIIDSITSLFTQIKSIFDTVASLTASFGTGTGVDLQPVINNIKSAIDSVKSLLDSFSSLGGGDLLKNLFGGGEDGGGGGLSALFPEPTWLKTLTGWTPPTTLDWVTSMVGWTPPTTLDWVTSMVGWIPPTTVDWVTSMVGWIPPQEVPWVTSLLGWSPGMPGWVGALLGWGPPSGGAGPGQDVLPPGTAASIAGFGGGAGVAAAGFGGGVGGVTIRIAAVHVHNEMDIEVLAAQLARRFQQKLR